MACFSLKLVRYQREAPYSTHCRPVSSLLHARSKARWFFFIHPSMRAESRPAASPSLVSIPSPSPTRLQSPTAPMRRPRPEITFERSPTRSPQLAAPLPAGHSPCTSPPSTSSTCMDGPVPSPHPPRALSHRSCPAIVAHHAEVSISRPTSALA